MKIRSARLIGAVVMGMTAAAAEARADDAPPVRWDVAVEVEADHAYRADDPALETSDLYPTVEPELRVRLAPGFALYAHGVLEPVRDLRPREDRAFADLGLYLEDLSVEVDRAPLVARAGKFTPRFGIAWDLAPGVFGTDFAEDYELSERIGIEAGIAFGGAETGTHSITASAFFLDDTPLSRSLFTDRGRTRRADGGPSNTGDPSSFVLAVDGEKVMGIEGLAYRVAVLRQARGSGAAADETGVSAGLVFDLPLGRGISLTPLVEAVLLSDAGGIDGDDIAYFTAGGTLAWEAWSVAASMTARKADLGGMRHDDYLAAASIGYAFADDLSLALGWSRRREAGIESDTVGLLFTWAFGGAWTP